MRDLGVYRNAEYTVKYQPMKSMQDDLNSKYERYLVPSGRPTNNTFYAFGGKSNINQAKGRETVLSPKLLTNSELNTTSRGKSLKILKSPALERVVDYTKNISEGIFSPASLARDFKSSIPVFARPKSAMLVS